MKNYVYAWLSFKIQSLYFLIISLSLPSSKHRQPSINEYQVRLSFIFWNKLKAFSCLGSASNYCGYWLSSKRVLLDHQGLSVPHTNFSVNFSFFFGGGGGGASGSFDFASATFVADSPTGEKPLPRSCGTLSQISFDFFKGVHLRPLIGWFYIC